MEDKETGWQRKMKSITKGLQSKGLTHMVDFNFGRAEEDRIIIFSLGKDTFLAKLLTPEEIKGQI